MKGLSYVGGMVLLWAACLVIIGAAARVMWWLLELGWSML
jgi:hypothetical protein